MSFWILSSCFLVTTLWSSVHGTCNVMNWIDGCHYTVHCVGNPASIYDYGCDEKQNVTFIMEASIFNVLSLSFFSSTNFDQRVRQFKAIENNWDVIEPNAFKYYRKSVFMDLSQNRIVNLKDEAFNELTVLKFLNLSNNMIKYLHDKSLQLSVVSQNSLEVLDLSNNHLMSIGSNVFSNLENLKILLLHNNQIKTIASNCFSILRYLKYLDIRNNKISSLNTTLVTMSELQHLELSRNNINKLAGIDLIRLVSLIYFNISHNAIESIESNCFNQAFRLQTLDLSNNRITTPIEKQMFSYNTNLTYLNLYGNDITALGDSIFKSAKLNYLNIENNNITGDVTSNTFSGLQKITCLNITHQHITAIKNNAFSEMINLEHLDLSYNDIGSVENSSFVNTSALIVLNFSHNLIKNLDFLKMFSSNLTDIYINDNLISIIPEYIFSNHSSLINLDLSANVITIIEPNSLPLNNIKNFNFKNNNLSGTLVDGVFSPARFLKHLDLSHQNLKAINKSAFINLPLLENLDLSDNNIQYIDINNFNGVDNLCILNISNNNLTNLNIDGNLGKLNTLLLSNNKFTYIPNITKFTNVSKHLDLDLSYNNIFNVTYPGFNNLTNLSKLYLSYNNISYFNNQFTNTLTSLLDLNLESNHLKEINLTYFKNLRSVNISDNDITYLDVTQFRNLEDLKLLDVRANKIKEISPGTFQHLKSLQFLIISENNITNLRFGDFRGLNTTKVIDLSQNRINAINVDVFHECYELRKIIIDYNNISSVDIERLVEVSPNLELISLGGNPIACKEIVRSSKKNFSDRYIEITSMHKIYHEDNVHGIRCGENTSNVTTEEITTQINNKPKSETGVSNSIVLLTWCAVMSVLLIVGLGFVYWRQKRFTMISDTRMQFQNTENSRNSECYNDLLS